MDSNSYRSSRNKSPSLTVAALGALVVDATVRLRDLFRPAPEPLTLHLRQHLATTLDSLRQAQETNRTLLAAVSERDGALATLQEEHGRMTMAMTNLIKSLNAANVRYAELQRQLHAQGIREEGAYFLATLSDGTIAGPFSRS